MDRELLELSSKHQLEIDNHKLHIAKLTDEKNIVERNIQDLTKGHETNVESLIAERNAMIEATKNQHLDREKEFEQKISSLSNVLETHKSKITKLESDKQTEKEIAVREAIVFDLRITS